MLGLIRSFLVAKWLGPKAFGTWQFANIFARYTHYADLGTRSAIQRKIPYLRGKGDVEAVQTVLNSAFVNNCLAAILYSAAVFGCSLFVKESFDSKVLAAYSPVILLSCWLGYNKMLAISTGHYSVRRRFEILYDVSNAVLSVVFVYQWGVYGAILGFGISALMTVIYAARKLLHQYGFEINWRMGWDLILGGLPIMANGILLTAMGTADQIVIAAMLSRDILGVYGVANTGVGILRTIPVSVGSMLFVKFAEMDGKRTTKKHISDALDKSTTILSILLAPIVSMAVACFPIAVVWLLPQFVRGIGPGRLLIAGVFFLAVSLPAANWCVSTGRFMPVLALRSSVVAVEFAAVYLVVKNSARLEFIALCILGGSAVFCVSIIIMSNWFLKYPLSNGLIRASRSLAPFLCILAAIWMQDYVYHTGDYVAGVRLFVSCILALAVSLTTSIPFLYLGYRKMGLSP
jgi:O-antigen/teichoic acid export membrane protein